MIYEIYIIDWWSLISKMNIYSDRYNDDSYHLIFAFISEAFIEKKINFIKYIYRKYIFFEYIVYIIWIDSNEIRSIDHHRYFLANLIMMKDVTNHISIYILKNIENNQFFEKKYFRRSTQINIFKIDLINYYIAKI